MTQQQDWNVQVLVLCPKGTQLGRMRYCDAQKLALEDYGLDLVHVNKDHEFPVYKIMDYGKWKYDQRKHRKKNHVHIVKEMNFKVRIETHDLRIKINQIKNFLSRGDDVRIAVVMKGRERSHPELAREKLDDILSELEELGRAEQIKSTVSSVATVVRPLRSNKSHGKNIQNQNIQSQTSSGNSGSIRQGDQKSSRKNVEMW